MALSWNNRAGFQPLLLNASLVCLFLLIAAASARSQNPPYYDNNQTYYPNNTANYSTSNPFKTEVAKLEAFVYRPGKETLPLMKVPRLQEGDVLKVRMLNEAVNGITPDKSNYDWTILVAYINPSRNQDAEKTLSEEIRLREKGWYKDHFFKVPYDSQPIIFLYPKSNFRKKILSFIEKKPDEIRQMGEKVIEISSAYAQVSSFLFQLQNLMLQQPYNNYSYGGSYYGGAYGQSNNQYFQQSVEGLARSFNIQLPSCWTNNSGNYSYSPYSSNLQSQAQCISKNIRLEDLNFSVGKMLQQGALMAVAQLTRSHPGLSQWIAIAAIAIDFIMKLTSRTAIRIIPAISSSSESPLYSLNSPYTQNNVYNSNNTGVSQNVYGNNFEYNGSNKISLFGLTQPSDRDYLTVYAFVPHKWQPDADPEVFNLYPPVPEEPCFHAGKNLLRNNDLRLEWLTDTFTRDFKLVLSDGAGWKKEFNLKKNLGLNSWEADIAAEELNRIPKTSAAFDAKITGVRGFNTIESPNFKLLIANGGSYEVGQTPAENGKTKITLKKVSGNGVCSQNVTYKAKSGQPTILPLTQENNFVKFNSDKSEISFETDQPLSEAEFIQIQQYGGEKVSVFVKP